MTLVPVSIHFYGMMPPIPHEGIPSWCRISLDVMQALAHSGVQ